jgi:hypothetical protein
VVYDVGGLYRDMSRCWPGVGALKMELEGWGSCEEVPSYVTDSGSHLMRGYIIK